MRAESDMAELLKQAEIRRVEAETAEIEARTSAMRLRTALISIVSALAIAHLLTGGAIIPNHGDLIGQLLR